MPVHEASREYLRSGSLLLPVSRYVTTSGFRGVSDQVLSYYFAGSFVLHLTERFGLPAVLRFFQTNNAFESVDAIRARMQTAFGVTLEEAENSWLTMLRG